MSSLSFNVDPTTPLYLANFIDGQFVKPRNKRYLENINPATGQVINKVPDSQEEDVQAAVDAALVAYKTWRKTTLDERAELFHRLADLIDKRREELTITECRDMGKSRFICDNLDANGWAAIFRHMADLGRCATTNYFQMDDAISIEHRDSVGVCGLISPWNFPLLITIQKVASSLIMGNTAVLKPSEISPSTAYLLCQLFNEVGFPKGVLNVVHGHGVSAGQAIVEHPKVRAVSFTGGTVTGRNIARAAAANIKKVHLELGGKNPAIVFDDCYFDETIENLTFAAFGNTGQICLCASRQFVHESIYDRYVQAFVHVAKNVYGQAVGDPLKPETMVGPLSSFGHREKVEKYLQLAKQEGGKILCGGGRPTFSEESGLNDGAFVQPTVIVGLPYNCRTATEEIFGPIVTIHKFSSEEEALEMANASEYGLSASVWSSDARRGMRVARELEAGMVWINCWVKNDWRQPFGGVKQSGNNKESGLMALEFFSEIKPIVSKL